MVSTFSEEKGLSVCAPIFRDVEGAIRDEAFSEGTHCQWNLLPFGSCFVPTILFFKFQARLYHFI